MWVVHIPYLDSLCPYTMSPLSPFPILTSFIVHIPDRIATIPCPNFMVNITYPIVHISNPLFTLSTFFIPVITISYLHSHCRHTKSPLSSFPTSIPVVPIFHSYLHPHPYGPQRQSPSFPFPILIPIVPISFYHPYPHPHCSLTQSPLSPFTILVDPISNYKIITYL